jgi:hypothetical protein
MNKDVAIIKNYRNLVLCYVFFLLSVGFYLLVLINFPNFIFIKEEPVNTIAFFTVWGQYISFLLLIVIFVVALSWRLYLLTRILYKAQSIKIMPFWAVLGFLFCYIFPWFMRPKPLALIILAIFPLIYLAYFWLLSRDTLQSLKNPLNKFAKM